MLRRRCLHLSTWPPLSAHTKLHGIWSSSGRFRNLHNDYFFSHSWMGSTLLTVTWLTFKNRFKVNRISKYSLLRRIWMYLRSWSDFNQSLWRISHWQLHRSRCNKSDTGFKYHGLLHGRRMHLRSMRHKRNSLWYWWRHQWHRSLYSLQMHWSWPHWPFNMSDFWTLSQLHRWLRRTVSHMFESSWRSYNFTNTRNRVEQIRLDCPWNKYCLGNP